MAPRKTRRRGGQRGIALIMVILVLLVLTVLGITASMMMTQEDRISSRQDQQRAALYVAEAGLRQGELILSHVMSLWVGSSTIQALLDHTATGTCTAVTPNVPQHPQNASQWDITHLGTYLTQAGTGGLEMVNQELVLTGSGQLQGVGNYRAYYSLYVRNNSDDRDPTGAIVPATNFDTRVRLVSVGFVTDAQGLDANGNGNILAVKILEEEYNHAGAGSGKLGQQIDQNMQATNSGVYGP